MTVYHPEPAAERARNSVGRRYLSDQGNVYEVLSSDGAWVVVRMVSGGAMTDGIYVWHVDALITMRVTTH